MTWNSLWRIKRNNISISLHKRQQHYASNGSSPWIWVSLWLSDPILMDSVLHKVKSIYPCLRSDDWDFIENLQSLLSQCPCTYEGWCLEEECQIGIYCTEQKCSECFVKVFRYFSLKKWTRLLMSVGAKYHWVNHKWIRNGPLESLIVDNLHPHSTPSWRYRALSCTNGEYLCFCKRQVNIQF